MNAGMFFRSVFVLTAVTMVANGLWMLGDAFHWFRVLPVALEDTGSPNGHFIRDVGVVYLLMGGALAWVMQRPAERRAVFVLVALFMVLHALEHVAEILLGAMPPTRLLLDLPLVLAPGLLFGAFMHPAAWRRLLAP